MKHETSARCHASRGMKRSNCPRLIAMGDHMSQVGDFYKALDKIHGIAEQGITATR